MSDENARYLSISRRETLTPEEAWEQLCRWFLALPRTIVLLSGGVDSSLLLKAASSVSSAKTIAFTADSPSLARAEVAELKAFVKSLNVPHFLVPTDELDDPAYVSNAGDRCYYCKKALYRAIERNLPKIKAEAADSGDIVVVVDGTNQDDLSDHRPSLPASREHGVRHPYLELKFGKGIIREVSRLVGLPNWNKPAMACLSSRIQDGVTVSAEKLKVIERGEELLKGLGIEGNIRLRYHESGVDKGRIERIARIEVDPSEVVKLFTQGDKQRLLDGVVIQLRELGFSRVTVDLEGYKRGGGR